MSEPDVSSSDVDIKILLQLHNMAAVRSDKAVEAEDVAKTLTIKIEELASRLVELARGGYVISLEDEAGNQRFHLTGLGMIKVASLFS